MNRDVLIDIGKLSMPMAVYAIGNWVSFFHFVPYSLKTNTFSWVPVPFTVVMIMCVLLFTLFHLLGKSFRYWIAARAALALSVATWLIVVAVWLKMLWPYF